MIMKVFGGSWGLGAFLGLQIQWSASEVDGGFDSHILPPKSSSATVGDVTLSIKWRERHFMFYINWFQTESVRIPVAILSSLYGGLTTRYGGRSRVC